MADDITPGVDGVTPEQFDQMLRTVVVPPAPMVQPENVLRPDPARIAFDLRLLQGRVSIIEDILGIDPYGEFRSGNGRRSNGGNR